MKFMLPPHILTCLNTLNNAGFEAFVVGGAVRDHLMGLNPNDYDIATNARPDNVKQLFEKTVATGEKHGTITVFSDAQPIEVTTYRSDGDYLDSRHPKEVSFKNSIADDLSRRDFTVNAFAYHPQKGMLDLFCGQQDLENKLLRTVGNASARFNEDALRIMRAFRFASQLNFSIDDETLSAALKQSHLLINISAERIGVEFIKLLCGKKPECIIQLLQTDILSRWGIMYNGCELDALGQIPASPEARMALFCYLTGSDPKTICTKLKYSKRFTQITDAMHRQIINGPIKTAYEMRKAFPLMNTKQWGIYFKICHVLFTEDTEAIAYFNEIKEQNLPCCIADLNISGDDMQALGIKGVAIGKTLQYLLESVLQNPMENQKEKLMVLAKDFQKTL